MYKNWFQKKPQAAANGAFRHGNEHLIELRNIVKTFNSAAGTFTALKGVDLQIGRGEFLAIIGKSGSGKSTLMNMITGIDRPTSGDVLIGDVAVHTLDESRMAVWRGRTIGVVFQFFQLLPALSLVENVMLPMEMLGEDSNGALPRAEYLLESVGLIERRDHYPAQLSGGEQQRVALARAFMMKPSVLFADEPTGNLDSMNGKHVLDLMLRRVDLLDLDFFIAVASQREIFRKRLVDPLARHHRIHLQDRRTRRQNFDE